MVDLGRLILGRVSATQTAKRRPTQDRSGTFIGEMSFIRGGPATATVQIVQPTRYTAWSKSDLRGVLDQNPAIRSTMQTIFSEDLTNKLFGDS